MSSCAPPKKVSLDCFERKDDCAPQTKHCGPTAVAPATGAGYQWGACGFIVWWIILALIIGFILFLFRPTFLLDGRDRDGYGRDRDDCADVNWGTLVVWSLVVALVIIIIFWLLSCFCGGNWGGFY